MAMKARDVMTPRVISIEAAAPIVLAVRLMLQSRISGLPVVGPKGELVGMVTEGDFLRRGEIGTERHRSRWLEFLIGPGRLAGEYVHARGRKVEEVMTREPFTITEDTPLDEAVRLMERRRIKRLPVVREGRIVGIVTRANIMHALVSLAVEEKAPAGNDAAIREQILTECKKQSWAPMTNVVVRNGVVGLWGVITDERERQALIVASENVPGVKAVHDHLVWIEPNSGFVIQSEEDEARTKAQEKEQTDRELPHSKVSAPVPVATQTNQTSNDAGALIIPG
jgi:CBS domain-containing protein